MNISSFLARSRFISRLATILIGGVLLGLGLGCSQSSLVTLPEEATPIPDNRLKIQGEVCTRSPQELEYPLRVIFLVDCSESMEVNDPPDPVTGETGRERAVRETAESLLQGNANTEVSLVRFSSEAQPLTETTDAEGQFAGYFTPDLELIKARLPFLAETDRTTNFINALSEAYAELRDELTRANQESLARSTYQVILVSDGIPDVEGNETAGSSAENILESVDALVELGAIFHVESLGVNTALLSSGNAEVDAQAEALLKDMAERGEGTYRAFSSGSELNFLYIDLSTLTRVYTLKTLVAMNLNALSRGDAILADADGDGLSDQEELLLGSAPKEADTDGDGCRDSLEQRYASSGLDLLDGTDCNCFVPDYCDDVDLNLQCDNGCQDTDVDGFCDCIDLDANGLCDPSNFADGDGDGLVDCEERYAGSNRAGPDTDGDGLLDFQELRFHTSPDVNDSLEDSDWDAVPNGEEVRTGTDPQSANLQGRSRLAYRYQVWELAQREEGRSCFGFEINNISLADLRQAASETHEPVEGTPEVTPASRDASPAELGPGGQGYTGWNRLLVYAGEVPFDDLESYAAFRVACLEARYEANGSFKDPPSGTMTLSADRFVSLATFDPARDCLRAGGSP